MGEEDKESELERWRRNFDELLQELRVTQAGNQILFAFLLTLPFTQRFTETTQLQRGVYVGTLTCTAIATILILAPVSHHRITFRKGFKPQVAQVGSKLAAASLIFILLGLSGALYLAIAIATANTWAALITAGIAALGVGMWYLLPLWLWMRNL
ncbi:MAG: amine oxidase [Longispora sp.]|nr:amine oxidase [Longispora sp. (in: high G+C Gram-positive bacteria)]